MYKRILDLTPILRRKSLFLLGPRQTGKSTYMRSHFKEALYINLLKSSEYQKLLKNPSQLQDIVRYAFENDDTKLIVIDEIQRLPELLNEVHDLIESNKALRFILTGSSARKIKRSDANLLGGRATWFNFYPICYPELGNNADKIWLQRMSVGALPSIMSSENPFEDLKDYVGLYIREEIQAEGMTRSLENFNRFLDFMALMNGEQLNFTSIGSDAQISPSTVRNFVEILSDTLMGHVLPAFQATKKRKAVTTSKFYLFDCGVTNALLGRKEVVPGTPEYGKQLEQAIFLEIKAYLDYKRSGKKVEFWRSTSQFEVDFLVYEKMSDIIAIEVKSKVNPTRKDFKGLLALEEDVKLKRKIIICTAESPQKTSEGIEILPIDIFLKALWAGKIL